MKRKVLHVSCGGLGHGGISTVIFSIVENLHEKFDFDCVVFKKRCDREELFLRYGNIHRINCYNTGKRSYFELIFRPFILFHGIYKTCKKNKYDIIHVHNNYDEGICLFAAKCAGVKIRISHSHISQTPNKITLMAKLHNFLNLILVNKYSTHRVGCSETACKDYFKKGNYRVIFNSIDLEKYKYNAKIKKDNNLFIHVGRYSYSKNQEFVIKTFKEIIRFIPEAKLKLIGFGHDEEKLKRIVRELDLNDNIMFVPGEKTDVSKEYDKAKYMIFPSLFEGFGIVLIEAQSKGIKCYVSKEAIQKEVDAGLLIFISLKKSPEEWAKLIVDDINNDDNIDNLKIMDNLSRFSSSTISKQYEELYEGGQNDTIKK